MARYLVARTFAAIFSQRSTVAARILTGRILGVVRDESGALLTSATDMRVNKTLVHRGSRYLELGAEIRNVPPETDIDSLVTQVFSRPNVGAPGAYAIPRQLMFRVRGCF